jgi:Skp family chaperone for outer membrane proteins
MTGRRTLRVLATAAILVVAAAVPGRAQQARGGRGPQDVETRLQHMKTQLNLSDAQVEQLKPVLEKQQTRMQHAFQEHQGDRQAMQAEMTKMRVEMDKELGDILSAEQMKQYQQMRQERTRRGPPGGPPAGPPPTGR